MNSENQAKEMATNLRVAPAESMELSEKINLAFDSYSKQINSIKQSYSAMDRSIRADIQKKFKTRSRYLAPDFEILVSTISTTINNNLPGFLFNLDPNKYAGKVQLALYKYLLKSLSKIKLKKRISEGIQSALLSGLFLAEVQFNIEDEKGTKTNEDGSIETYTVFRGANIDLKIYDVKKNEVYIDPLASSFDILNSADWIVVKDGLYHKSYVEDTYDVDLSKIPEQTVGVNNFGESLLNVKGYEIHKIYYKSGLVKTFLNKKYLLSVEQSSLGTNNFPFIAFTLFPTHNTIYGQTPWDKLEQSVYFKSGIINLIATNAIKSITSPLITDSATLAQQGSLEDFSPDEIIGIEPDLASNRPVSHRFSQLHWEDMTIGLKTLYEVVDADSQKIGRVSNLALGVQDKVVRTTDIAMTMQQGSVSLKKEILNTIETDLYQELGKIMLRLIYENYFSFDVPKGLDRELFKEATSIEVVNGSLEVNSPLDAQLAELFTIAAQNPYDFDLTDILKDYFTQKGLNIDSYKSDPQTALFKSLLAMGLSQAAAKDMVIRVAQQQQAQEQQ